MKKKHYWAYSLLICSLYALTLGAQEATAAQEVASSDEDLVADVDFFLLSRAGSIPDDELEAATDHYLEGYIQALVDMHYYEHKVIVVVKDHKVYLYNLPHNDLLSNSIISFVKDVPGVKEVEVAKEEPAAIKAAQAKYAQPPRINGIWFPQMTELFQPFVADPRLVNYSVAYRAGDRVIGQEAVAVSLGDDFPIYRWNNVFCWKGDLQIGIEAAIWAVFNFHDVHPKRDDEWCELVNTDYYVGVPVAYAFDRWSFRMRVYHISSHLGDELIVNHPKYLHKRKNPSFEAFDFFTSYQFNKNLRGYFGPGVILHSDHSFPMKTFYVEYGAELRILGRKFDYHRLYGTPFFAIHLENWQVRNWDLDATFKLGYEFSKLAGIGRKMRLFASYHHGFSYEGQFFKKRTQYGEFGFSWGF